jgi:ABC-type nitrate/sulfonate/bicarbonate transport system ATPase subunit
MPPPGPNAGQVKIRIHGVAKAFRAGKNRVDVLEDVHLEVREREFVAVVGPSGCGKTTLLNCIAGFEPVDAGRIEIDGQPVREPSSRRVFVFQEPGIFPWLDVASNIGFGLPRRMAAATRSEIVARCIDLVGLQGFERALPHELSGGMKQRVEYARALAVDPDVLFLDEPFGALDAITRLEMRREIVRIWHATGKTCILVTHDVEEACELAGRIAVMTRRPSTIKEIVDNPLPRPRDPDQAAFRQLKEHIFAILGVERRV